MFYCNTIAATNCFIFMPNIKSISSTLFSRNNIEVLFQGSKVMNMQLDVVKTAFLHAKHISHKTFPRPTN